MVESHKIEVVPYDQNWPIVFRDEAVRIQRVLGDELSAIDHIGSTSMPDDTFNYVLDADFTLEHANEKIAEITAFFEKTESPFSWWLSPNDKPHGLADCLMNHDYKNTENNHAMYFDLDAWNEEVPPISALKIVRANDEKTLRDFAGVLTPDMGTFETYFQWIASVLTEEDPIEYYVGYVNEKPVVRGLTCYFAQVAGFYWLSTSPSERQKGYGAAMQIYQLHRAKSLGFHVAILEASDEAYPFYLKLGYRACGRYFREFKQKRGLK